MNFRNILWTYAPRQDGSCNVKIYVQATGQKKYYKTDICVLAKDWDAKKGIVKTSHPLCMLYNSKIREFRNRLEEHFLNGGSFDNFNESPEKASLIAFGKQLVTEAEKGTYPLQQSTVNVYKSILKKLEQYMAITGMNDLAFNDVGMDFYVKYTKHLEETGCKLAGIGKHMKCIKRLMNIALERKLHNNTSHQERAFKAHKTQTSTKIYLSVEEMTRIEQLDLSSQSALEQERDRFLVQYYLLLRFSDVMRIKEEMFFELKGDYYFRIKHQKTGNEAVVPVKPSCRTLLEKYNYTFDYSSNVQANRHLKTIAAMAGIATLVIQDGRTLMKSQFVGTHTARRSAATNLYLQGVDVKVIADLGGWENFNALMVYLRASGLETAQMAVKLEFFQ